MGFPMAKHLINSGYELIVAKHSNKQESLDRLNELEALGAIIKDNIIEVPIDTDLIISILPTDAEVRSVFINEEFHNNIKGNTVILEMTSCNSEIVMELEKYYLDKPVSGGVIGAVNGTLTILGSGDKEVYDNLIEILKVLGKNINYVGKLGAGKTLKSINQMMIAINTLGVIEGYYLAKEHGVDFDIMYNVIKDSSGNSYAFNRYLDRLILKPDLSLA